MIVGERDAVRNPAWCIDAGVVRLLDCRRRKLTVFFSIYAVMLLIGGVLCLLTVRAGHDVMIVVAFYFGYVGGLLTYYGVFKLGRARACSVYPQVSLVEARTTWFGLDVGRQGIDFARGELIVQSARLRGKRNTRDPLLWFVFPFVLLLGPFAALFGLPLERMALMEGSVLCVRGPSGRIETVMVASGASTTAGFLAVVDSETP